MRPNWFVAFPLPGAFLGDLPTPPSGLSLFHPDDVHLTLAFLGACGEKLARDAFQVAARALVGAELGVVEISLGPVVAMGDPGRYSALAALLERGRAQLEGVIGEHRGAVCAAAGVAPDRRAPKPHATLARPLRRATDEERAAGIAWASALDVSSVHAALERVALYTWGDSRSERKFRSVEECKFAGAPSRS